MVQVMAVDGGAISGGLNSSVNVSVTIRNVNAYDPSFTQPSYEVFLPEGSYNGDEPFVVVHATDLDCGDTAQIMYAITLGDTSPSSFELNATTGAIYQVRLLCQCKQWRFQNVPFQGLHF